MWFTGFFINATASCQPEGVARTAELVSFAKILYVVASSHTNVFLHEHNNYSLVCSEKNSIDRHPLLLRQNPRTAPNPGFNSEKHFPMRKIANQLASTSSSWIPPPIWHFSLGLLLLWPHWSPRSPLLPFKALGHARRHRSFSLVHNHQEVKFSQYLDAATKGRSKRKERKQISKRH